MITCDTQALIYWSLAPERLSSKAAQALETGRSTRELACADIVLWEIAMLAAKERIKLPTSSEQFIQDLVAALSLSVLPITASIAMVAQNEQFVHGDPADRLIGATALSHQAKLISADEKLACVPGLNIIW